MKNSLTVFKKEMRRFLTDPRMLMALFLPGLLIFVLYTVMGRLVNNVLASPKIENTSYRIAYTDNACAGKPQLLSFFDQYLAQADEEKTNTVEYYPVPVTQIDASKDKLVASEYDVLCVFSDDFEAKIDEPAVNPLLNYVYLFYDGSTAKGTHAYQILSGMVDLTYKNYVINIDTSGKAIQPNLAKTDFTSNRLMSILVPMLTMSMLFSAVVSICPDAVAGEKERGTLSAMLLTPIKRGELAFGKILALSVTAALSGLTSFLGLLGGLPALMSGLNITFAPSTIVLLAVLIITTLIQFVSLGTLVSTLSKSSKECSSYMAPLMIISMAAAVLPLALDTSQLFWSFIPFLNIAVCMNVLVSTGSIGYLFMGISIGMNLLFTGLLIFFTARLFNSERFMVK